MYEVRSDPQPYTCSKVVSPRITARHTRGEGKDVKVWHRKCPGQGCWTLLWWAIHESL